MFDQIIQQMIMEQWKTQQNGYIKVISQVVFFSVFEDLCVGSIF